MLIAICLPVCHIRISFNDLSISAITSRATSVIPTRNVNSHGYLPVLAIAEAIIVPLLTKGSGGTRLSVASIILYLALPWTLNG